MLESIENWKQMRYPKIDLSYSYLSEPQYIDSYKFENKVGINFAYPIFLS
jgi:outer membrane protein TolC